MSSRIGRSLGSAILLAIGLAASPVFAVHSSASTFTQLCQFEGTNCNGVGFEPRGGILKDSSGNVFGTLYQGGAHSAGAVFELTAGGTYTEIYAFCKNGGACSDGELPESNLIMDVNGNLYGTTVYGGDSSTNGGDGVVFELSPPTAGHTKWKEKVLYAFCSVEYWCSSTYYDGATPQAGLAYAGQSSGSLYDGTSALYGTTSNGGGGSGLTPHGTVFELTNASGVWTENVIYPFCGCGTAPLLDGVDPATGVAVDSSGNLYGTADGGSGGHGMAYELSNSGGVWSETILYTFCTVSMCTDGAGADANGVSVDASGNVWGTTVAGGNSTNNGVLYKLSAPAGGSYCSMTGLMCETIVHTFCTSTGCPDGAAPSYGLGPAIVRGASPIVVYGTTSSGGANGQGVIYAFSVGYHDVHDFCGAMSCTDGADPVGGLTIDSSGTLYGTTYYGGISPTSPFGTAFSFAP